jgi:hypothetical protein
MRVEFSDHPTAKAIEFPAAGGSFNPDWTSVNTG